MKCRMLVMDRASACMEPCGRAFDTNKVAETIHEVFCEAFDLDEINKLAKDKLNTINRGLVLYYDVVGGFTMYRLLRSGFQRMDISMKVSDRYLFTFYNPLCVTQTTARVLSEEYLTIIAGSDPTKPRRSYSGPFTPGVIV